MRKGWVVGLLGLNLFLLTILILLAYRPPAAVAQEIVQDKSFILISARAQQNTDVLYLVDRRTERLHAFRIQTLRQVGGPTQILLSDSRDLRADFGVQTDLRGGNRNRGPGRTP